jgi:hypothetical protein
MYLTDKKNGVPRDMHEHEELEVLLEFFSKQVEEIANEAENIEVDPIFHVFFHGNLTVLDRPMCNPLRRS